MGKFAVIFKVVFRKGGHGHPSSSSNGKRGHPTLALRQCKSLRRRALSGPRESRFDIVFQGRLCFVFLVFKV